MSQTLRPMIERVRGWLENVAGLRKTKHRGEKRVGWIFPLALGVYDLVRMKNLEVVT